MDRDEITFALERILKDPCPLLFSERLAIKKILEGLPYPRCKTCKHWNMARVDSTFKTCRRGIGFRLSLPENFGCTLHEEKEND